MTGRARMQMPSRRSLRAVVPALLMLLNPTSAFDEVADIKIIGVNRHETNETAKCEFLKPADHVAYLRTGVDAIIGDSVAEFNATQNATTTVPGTKYEEMRIEVDDDGDEIAVLVKEKGQICVYDATVQEGSVMGIKGEKRFLHRTVYEAAILKVGALNTTRSPNPATCQPTGDEEPSLWTGQHLGFARFGKELNETEVVLGRQEHEADADVTDVGKAPIVLWKENGGLILSTARKEHSPDGCVFSATVVNGTALGVSAKANATRAP